MSQLLRVGEVLCLEFEGLLGGVDGRYGSRAVYGCGIDIGQGVERGW